MREKGQSLFEIIIAIAVIAVALTAILGLGTQALGNSSTSQKRTQATRATAQAMEWIRAERDTSWDEFVEQYASTSGEVWCLDSVQLGWNNKGPCGPGEILDDTFRREATLTVRSGDDRVVEVEVVTLWEDRGETLRVRTDTALTDWRRN